MHISPAARDDDIAPPRGQAHRDTPPPPPQDPSPRRRPRRWPQLVAGGAFAVAGALFVAGATASEDGALRVDRTGGLREDLAARAAENVALQAEVDVLAAQVAALQNQAPQGPVLERTQEQIAALAPVVGLTEVTGPGVTVTLGDAPVPDVIPDGLTGDDYIVHQEDVQGAVNALWRGGASGVTVMGQRLISTSAVRCVGNTVILHGRVYSPPFVIAGVGNIASLERALATEPALQFFRDWSTVVGLKYDQKSSPRMTLPPFNGPLSAKYAEVVR